MSEVVYKLTDSQDRTFGNTQWEVGVEHTAPGGDSLCSKAWLHAYRDPILAVLLDPIHCGYGEQAHLWRCEAVVGLDDGTKLGCTWLRTVERMPLPQVTIEQRVRFGILAAMEVCLERAWLAWAERWLSGEDRSERAAERAAWDARAAAWAAAIAATRAAAIAATRAAAIAATRAVWAAWAAWAAEDATWHAAKAASAARAADTRLDLVAIAHRACDAREVVP